MPKTNKSRFTINELLNTTLLSRAALQRYLDDPRRDYDKELGYPDAITREQYRGFYDRDGIAARVVDVYPDECWAMDPEVFENEEQESSPFEEAFLKLNRKRSLFHYLHRVDRLSGIGHFGLMLLGLDDGENDLAAPVPGAEEAILEAMLEDGDAAEEGGETPKKPPRPGTLKHKLLYIRVFDETLVDIKEWDQDTSSPRYGQPKFYNVRFVDLRADKPVGMGMDLTTKTVHWTRVLHVADNRMSSETFGTPRLQPVYNRILDIRKVLGGSSEMFWKGGFPGYSFETVPELGEVELDKDSMRDEMELYMNGLKRYMAFEGLTAKSLAPQVASPEYHIKGLLGAVAISIGVPMRVFAGSEESKLSSTQDAQTWNKRLARRQNRYLTPQLLYPLIDRLIVLGCLPPPKEYRVFWPDLNTSTDQEKADAGSKRATALATYVGGGVEAMIPPMEFMTHILHMPLDVAQQIVDAASKHEATLLDLSDDPEAPFGDEEEGPPGATKKNPKIPPKPGGREGSPKKPAAVKKKQAGKPKPKPAAA